MLTVDISGFGGSYEWGCQKMLQLGMEFLKQHPEFSFDNAYKEYKNVVGIAISENESAKALDKAMMDDPGLQEHGPTGAMHQTVLHHLRYIHEHGHMRWIDFMKEHRDPEDFFEFDGTVSSIPKDLIRPVQ
jgi:hypothetical protein